MSKTYKCDRCGTLYEKNSKASFSISRGVGFSTDILDLCPECQKELENWFACLDYNYDQVCGKNSKEAEK